MEDVINGAPLGPRVLSVKPLEDFRLFLCFDNGEKRIFDAKPLFNYKAFLPLQNKAFFNLVKVGYGTVEWPNDIDYCPDTLYVESIPATDDMVDIIGRSAVAETQQSYEHNEKKN